MAERYERLFSLPENLYMETSPVVIMAGALLKDNLDNNVLAQLKLKNIGDKPIKAVRVIIKPFDTASKALGEAEIFDYLDLFVERDKEFGSKQPNKLSNPSTRAFSAEVINVVFDNDSEWNATNSTWAPFSSQKEIGDAELTKQYQIHFGEKAKYEPDWFKDLWFCACGAINRREEKMCHLCGNNLTSLLNCDFEQLKEEKEKRLAKERAEQREKEEVEKKAAEIRTQKRKKILAIVLPILIIVGTLSGFAITNRAKTTAKKMISGEYYFVEYPNNKPKTAGKECWLTLNLDGTCIFHETRLEYGLNKQLNLQIFTYEVQRWEDTYSIDPIKKHIKFTDHPSLNCSYNDRGEIRILNNTYKKNNH